MIPREHGAWGVLILSFALGMGAAGKANSALALFFVAVLALFLARYPLTLLVKGRQSARRAWRWGALYLGIAILALLPLLLVHRLGWLLLFGLLFSLFLAGHFYLETTRQQRTAWGELVGMGGLSMAAAGAYYVATGEGANPAWLLWLLAFLYHGSAAFYVKMKVRQRLLAPEALSPARRRQLGRGLLAYLGVILLLLLPLAVIGHLPRLALVAFLPLFIKSVYGVFWGGRPRAIKAIGWREAAHGVLFTGLLVAAYQFR